MKKYSLKDRCAKGALRKKAASLEEHYAKDCFVKGASCFARLEDRSAKDASLKERPAPQDLRSASLEAAALEANSKQSF